MESITRRRAVATAIGAVAAAAPLDASTGRPLSGLARNFIAQNSLMFTVAVHAWGWRTSDDPLYRSIMHQLEDACPGFMAFAEQLLVDAHAAMIGRYPNLREPLAELAAKMQETYELPPCGRASSEDPAANLPTDVRTAV